MSHHCIDWIPTELAYSCNLMWTLDFGIPELPGPKIWVEHGIPDSQILEEKQYYDDVYYLCSNDWSYNHLKEKGLKAFHVGHIFLDKTIPTRRNPRLFVYAPHHCKYEHFGLPEEWNNPPLTKEEILQFCKEYDCEDYITSVVDDTDWCLYKDLNPMLSNRYFNFGNDHFKKCRFLYETAKVIYVEDNSTFDVTGEAHGITILGREKQKSPKLHPVKINVLTDGQCCNRILNLMRDIINGVL